MKRLFLTLVLVLLAGVTGVYIDWTWKRPLPPRGGRYYFQRVELPVPSFRQGDEKWHADALGEVPENGTLGSAGCAVAAAAMVFQSYGIDTDPQQLNWFLTEVGGYTQQGWLYWERASWWAPDRVRHVYEDLPSYQLIDSNLARGNPVIVRVRFSSGITHFVVIAGKDGFDYLIRDPGAGAVKGLYPLRELGSDIEALRFYVPLLKTTPHAPTLTSFPASSGLLPSGYVSQKVWRKFRS
ncbi:MAG: C39 family peptidase [Chthoniobacterales bacterium]|nr:C39 family peptidase [Chthoniobacterales bacterium]